MMAVDVLGTENSARVAAGLDSRSGPGIAG
jgi:hypothetical protein